MAGKRVRALLVGCAVWACAVTAVPAQAAPNTNWGRQARLVLPADAAADPVAELHSVSCASPGNCSAVGRYVDSADDQGLLATRSAGVWAAGVKAALPAGAAAAPDVDLHSVSCASAGNCSAVGDYKDAGGHRQALLLTQASGTWATGIKAALPADAGATSDADTAAVSCTSPGNCSAVGRYTDTDGDTQGLLLTQSSGTWATGVKLSLPANAFDDPEAALPSVSCAAAGECTAVGQYNGGLGVRVTQTSGTWGAGVEVVPPAAGNAVLITSVSCPSVGGCSAIGRYQEAPTFPLVPLLLAQSSGTWAAPVKGTIPDAQLNPSVAMSSVSCASAGNCSAVGTYLHRSNAPQGVVFTQTAGTWAAGVPTTPPADAAVEPIQSLPAISCAAAGSCSAVGNYMFRSQALTQMAGVLAPAIALQEPADVFTPAVSVPASVSCPAIGECSAAGSYQDSLGQGQAMVVDATRVAATLSLTAPAAGTAGSAVPASSVAAALAGGAAPSGSITFTVFGPQASPPGACAAGGTKVGDASVSGAGSYSPSATFTPPSPGDYWWYASYAGDAGSIPAASSCGAAMAKTTVGAAPPPVPPPPPPPPAPPAAPPPPGGGAPLDVADLKRRLLRALAPTGSAAKLKTLRQRGGFTSSFKAPVAGKLTITWKSAAKKKPVVLASASATLGAGKEAKPKVRLTAKGKKALRAAKRKLAVAASATFTPTGGKPVSVSKALTLRR